MTAVKLRSSQGCWTCRVRRKKCDEARPVCATCQSLEIVCQYSDAKPDWFDGGAREKKMADELKAMVKRRAMERRERRWARMPDVEDPSPPTPTQTRKEAQANQSSDQDHVMGGTTGNPTSSTSEEDETGGMSSSSSGDSNGNSNSNNNTARPESETSTEESPTSSQPSSSSSPGTIAQLPIRDAVTSAVNSFPEDRSEMEVTMTMIYLDYVVPFLFPFYRPCLLESSRGWILVLLMKNRALFHTALALASWLYAVMLDAADGTHGGCCRASWAELQAQQEISLKALQEDIAALSSRGVANAFRDAVSCMQSVIQLLQFEVVMADTANWECHHDAAVALFDQVITHHANVNTDTDDDVANPWSAILDRISFPFKRIPLGPNRHILTSDQSAYRFYTAYLLWIDIVAATATGTAPRLRKYHAELLSGETPIIHLDEYVGCHSWAMLEIAAVAELAAWKRAQQAETSLSTIELVRRACAIQERIQARINTLELELGLDESSTTPMQHCPADSVQKNRNRNTDPSARPPLTPFAGFNILMAESEAHTSAAAAANLHTRIWAQATITYLIVVASGLNPALPEIQASVRETLELFRRLHSPLALRTLVWPFAVTGCLVLEAGDQEFCVRLVDDMGDMKIFGTVKEALNIMQNLWEHRGRCFVDPQMCDIATCFSLLGRCSLLV
ncbi:fungal-specific transcription factor domain-containing protein [Poronia punctata]|nr:fungal-specific transcription factor domain-containing protein [Poronia punctata]